MADDLKPMLTKVLSSRGEKKYFFAYGLGKRNDGKGDGELAVRGQKPKKTELEKALAVCKQVLEGVCWTGKGPDDGQTVYFQGKSTKLSTAVVAKMALTARHVLGRQYDFQIPSEKEERRAAALSEGDGDQEPAPQALAPGDDPALEWEAKLAEWSPAIKKAITEKGPNAGAVGKLLAQATALSKPGGDMAQALAKLTECHALANGAAPSPMPNGEEARWTARRQAVNSLYLEVLKKQPPNASLLQSLLAFADGKAEGKNFGQALLGLEKLEKLLQARNGTANAETGAKPAKPDGDEARWTARRQAVNSLYLEVLKKQPPNASLLRSLLAFADGKAEGKSFGQALLGLEKLEKLLQARNGTANAEAGAKPNGDEARWTARRQAVNSPYLNVLKNQPPNARLLQSLLAFADGKAASKDYGQALLGLEKLEKLLQARNGTANAEAGAKPDGDEARWTARRQAIEALYLKAVKEQPNKASQLRAVLAFADGKAEAKDFGKALLGLDKLETVMQAAAGTTNGADPAAEWKKKYADWTPAIKAAMAAKGPNAAAIAKLLAQATALSKPGGDMAQALAKLTECHALAASATVDGGGKDAAAAGKTDEPDSVRQYQEQIWKLNVDQWGPEIKAAIAAKGPNAAALAKLFAEATALSQPGGDMLQMVAKLRECHDLVIAAPSAVKPDLEQDAKDALAAKAEEAATGKGTAESPAQRVAAEEEAEAEAEEDEAPPTTNMGRWNKAKDKVDAQINRLCDWLRKTREKAAVEAAGKLAAAMDLFKVDLTSSLMNMDNASGEQKKQLYPKVSQILENYKKSLLADRLLAAAEDNPFVRVNARKPLLAALNQIQKNLEAEMSA